MSVDPVFLIFDWFRYAMISFGTYPVEGALAEYTLTYSLPVGVVPLISLLLRRHNLVIPVLLIQLRLVSVMLFRPFM